MAARETQGLQIALIIFVGLTLILGVTTFWYFRSYTYEFDRAQKDEAARREKEEALATITGDYNEVKRLLGVARNDELTKIVEWHKKDMAAHGANFPASKQTWRNLVDFLHLELDKAKAQTTDNEVLVEKLKAQIEADRVANTASVAKYSQGLDTSKKDIETRIAQDKATEDRLLGEKDNLSKLADKNGKEVQKQIQEKATATNKLTGRIKDLGDRLVDIKKRSELQLSVSEQADGRVTWVSSRQKTVYINLGSADGLKRQILFSVLGVDENNPVKAEKKGSIEVTQVLGEHLAEARIVEDNDSNPVLMGDQIFSQVWQPGQALRFALAGFIDLDGDGTSDRKRVRDIILQNGGVIDAEVTDKGQKNGAMTINTHYLVLGDNPVGKGKGSDSSAEKGNLAAAGYSDFENEAKTLPVKRMAVTDFLDLMGYRAEERTVRLDEEANPLDFKAKPIGDVPAKGQPNVFPENAFPKRAPKSAYDDEPSPGSDTGKSNKTK